MVYQLAYVSAAAGAVERSGLVELLTRARLRNGALDISGVLLYRDGRFLQLLEGSATAVGTVYRSIADDPRHTEVRCVWTAHGAARWFTDWTMGFRDLADDPVSHPAYVNLLTDAAPAGLTASTIHNLWQLLQADLEQDMPERSGPGQPPAKLAHLAGFRVLAENVRRGLRENGSV